MRAAAAYFALVVAAVSLGGCSGDTTTTVIKNTTVSRVTTTTAAAEPASQPPVTYDHSARCGSSTTATGAPGERVGYYDVRVLNANCKFGLAVAAGWTEDWGESCSDGCNKTVEGLECTFDGPPSNDVSCSYGNPTVRFQFAFLDAALKGD